MDKHITHTTTEKPSALDNFNLGFEYDMSWAEARKATKARTDKE